MDKHKFFAMTRVLVGQEIKKNYLAMLQMLESINDSYNMSEDDFSYYRKTILDYGNDTKRKADAHLDRIKISDSKK